MMLRGGFAEPIERRALIDRHARAVEQYLAVDRLCFGNPRLGRRTHERRAALGRTREPFGDGACGERAKLLSRLNGGGFGLLRQKQTSSVAKAERTGALTA